MYKLLLTVPERSTHRYLISYCRQCLSSLFFKEFNVVAVTAILIFVNYVISALTLILKQPVL